MQALSVMKENYTMDPMTRPSPTEGGLGDNPLEIHMKAFLKAVKSGDTRAMANAFHAAAGECKSMGYDMGGDDEAAEGEM